MDKKAPIYSPSSWACPSEEDNIAWEKLTREQQLQAMQEHFNHPDTSTPCEESFWDIVNKACQKFVEQE